MSKKSRTKKISFFLRTSGHSDKIKQMKADISNCENKVERDYVEDHYGEYYKGRKVTVD